MARIPIRSLLVALLVCVADGNPPDARAGCNLIPSAVQTFRSAQGTTNKPYAAPGDFVEIGVRPADCDVASPGLQPFATDHDVTLVFTPPDKGPRRIVLLTANCAAAAAKIATCEDTKGVGTGRVACVDTTANLSIVTRNTVPYLSFRFPDTDAFFAPDGDDRTLTGPVTIAVTKITDTALPCDLATRPCSAGSNLIACIDDLYDADGTCAPNPHPTFTHFTALPVPNDYQADCFAGNPPCTALATETRMAVDAAGNLLLPTNWHGILTSQANIPVPRLLRTTIKSPLPFESPPQTSVGSFTPEGAPLPPIFEPQVDPTITDPNVLAFFGSVDAPYTILRIARALGACTGGPHAGDPCIDSRDCGGNQCAPTCVGGTAPPNTPCVKSADCGQGGRCAALYDDFRPLVKSGGPLVMSRTTPGVCQLSPHATCTKNAQCPGDGNLCVSYALEANSPVALESLTAGTADLFAFTSYEPVDLVDRNGDGDTLDTVVTLRDRSTGAKQNLGAASGCGIAGTPEGRTVTLVEEPPFRFSAIAYEQDVVAFLEDESTNKYCDENGDGDRGDPILRVFELGQSTELTSDARVADPTLAVNGRSVAISNGRVFYRRSEAAGAAQTTTRASVSSGGVEGTTYADFPTMSEDGRYVVFTSASPNLVPGDTNATFDVFLRDRAAGTTERVNLKTGGGEQLVSGGTGGPSAITPDGQFVAFVMGDCDLVPGDTNGGLSDVFVRDRLMNTIERVSVATGGVQQTGGSLGAATTRISADGRYVSFTSDATNVVAGDTNSAMDVFVHDRQLDTTTRVDVPDGGVGQGDAGVGFIHALSADGRYVAFWSHATNLVPGPDANGNGGDVYVHDRQTLATTRVSVDSAGVQPAFGGSINVGMSADGRYVSFESDANALAPGEAEDFHFDCYVHDRDTGITERVSVGPSGSEISTDIAGCAISPDGRYVVFETANDNFVPGDTNGSADVFLHDRLTRTTQLVSVTASGAITMTGWTTAGALPSVVSRDGRFVAFESTASDLVAGDTNGVYDIFVRGIDSTDTSADLSGDADLDDTVLESFDSGTSTATTLCPAGDVAVTGGMAAFLRPEASGTTSLAKLPVCPLGAAAAGGVDLNGDSDADDRVVQLWTGSGNVQNLGLAATAVALSSTHVAAIGPGGTLATHAVSGGGWTDTGELADTIQFCGGIVAFLQPVAGHHVAKLYDPAGATVVPTGQVAEQIVCNDVIAAFRTTEADQGANLNGPPDGDQLDDVMQTYDLSRPACIAVSPPADCVGNSKRAVTPCRLVECDPRFPYRVNGDKVKFLTFEPDQGGQDLNLDGDALDLVIEVYDVVADVVTVVGTVTDGHVGDPTQAGEVGGDGTISVAYGRCIEPLATPPTCSTNAECGSSAFCDDDGTCQKDHGTCTADLDCPAGITCDLAAGAVIASADVDEDTVPDHVDDCIDVANASQADADGDGVGDACDRATCGDGLVEYDEQCDGASVSNCSGPCHANCTCTCGNTIADPGVKIVVKTKKESGQLVVKALLPLAGYTDEPITVRLDDDDPGPIVQTRIARIPPKGTPGSKWQYQVKTNGLQKVDLKLKEPGLYQLGLKAKRWFSTAAADGSAASTKLTITIGTKCFTHAATVKLSD